MNSHAPALNLKTEKFNNEKWIFQEEYFSDNFEYLHAIEIEMKYLLLKAFDNSEELYKEISDKIKLMELNTIKKNISINFLKLYEIYNLDEFEKNVIKLLFIYQTSVNFRKLFQELNSDDIERFDNTLKIKTILSIITNSYLEQLKKMKYFSVKSSLVKYEIIELLNDFSSNNFVMEMEVKLSDKILQYLLEDYEIYDAELSCISIINPTITLDRVIIDEKIKSDIIKYISGFYKNRVFDEKLTKFFDYGLNLTILFYGPSGTGKTMLAHAIANYFNKKLFCLNLTEVEVKGKNFSVILKEIFRKASLLDGIVFLDECDDILVEGTLESRDFLIEVEKAKCVIILASNKIKKLDPAIDRRISLKVRFEIPDVTKRYLIWKALIPPFVKLDKNINLKEFANRFHLTGGLIKNAIFMAINSSTHKDNNQIILSKEELEKATIYQTKIISQDREILKEELYPQKIKIDVFYNNHQKIINNLSKLIKQNIKKDFFNFSCFINTKNFHTANKFIEAIAFKSGVIIKKYALINLLEKRYDRFIQQEEVEVIDIVFSNRPGQKAIIIIEDSDNVLVNVINKEKSEIIMNAWKKIIYYLKKYNGIIFFIAKDIIKEAIIRYFTYYIELDKISKKAQIELWQKFFPGIDKNEIINFVKKHSLFLDEIEELYDKTKKVIFIEEGRKEISLKDVEKIINSYKIKKNIPILFGRNYVKYP